jgi:nicotinic acid mononucleotide adenylyltransferase
LVDGQLKTISDHRPPTTDHIYITDAVQIDVSATEIRQKIRENKADWQADVPSAVAKYIEKYKLYT